MNHDWILSTINKACNVEYGTRVVRKRDGGTIYPVYGGGGKTFHMDSFNRESRLVVARFAISEECARFVGGKFFLNDSGLTLSPREPNELLPRFLDYLTLSLNDTIYSLGRGSAQKNLDLPAFRRLSIQYSATISKQKRIVAILDRAFAGIDKAVANTEKNLVNARELFESHLNTVFTQKGAGWVEKKLGEVVTIKHGFAFKSQHFSNEGEYVLLTPGNFFEEGGYRDRGDKQKYYVGYFPADFMLKKGALLVAMTEQAAGLLGSPIIVPEGHRFLHNQRLGLVLPLSGMPWCNRFFFHTFNTRAFRKAVHGSASGVKVRHTSPKKMGAVVVAFPTSVSEQKKVVDELDKVLLESKRLENIYQQKLDSLAELKQSILQKAFTGELTAKPEKVLEEVAV